MARILTIEDDPVTAREIVSELQAYGNEVECVGDGRAGLDHALRGGYDAITLDRMLPGMDGLAVVTELRRAGVDTPVLMISALSDVDARVRGLRAGGDDYLTKPFAPDEMAARVEVLLRRRRAGAPDTVLRVGDLELDPARRSVTRAGEPVRLTARELSLLEFLMRRAGDVLTKQQILGNVWNFDFEGDPNIVESYIARLRRKLDKPFGRTDIETLRGSGYRLRADT